MKVLKFGGTSVGSPERMRSVAEIIEGIEGPKIVVLSAVSGTTNALVEIAGCLNDSVTFNTKISDLQKKYDRFIPELLKKEELIQRAESIVSGCFKLIVEQKEAEDHSRAEKIILAQGEILSTNLFNLYLAEMGKSASLLNALDFMRINSDAEPDLKIIKERIKPLLAELKSNEIHITQGFICRNAYNEIDNLKRGGSDYSASLIGAAVNAEEVQIWTDIDGMHNNDPRYIKNTYPIKELSFDEAAELAYFGAKILHPATILPAKAHNIPVRLKSTMDRNAEGTLITQRLIDKGIKAIAAKDGITAIKIKSARMLLAHGFLRRVFEVFEEHKTSIDMITTSEVAVSVTIDNDANLHKIVRDLEHFGTVEIDRNQSIICIVGNMVAEKTGVIRDVIEALAFVPLRMVSYGGSKHNISVLVDADHKIQALKDLNEGLFLNAKMEQL